MSTFLKAFTLLLCLGLGVGLALCAAQLAVPKRFSLEHVNAAAEPEVNRRAPSVLTRDAPASPPSPLAAKQVPPASAQEPQPFQWDEPRAVDSLNAVPSTQPIHRVPAANAEKATLTPADEQRRESDARLTDNLVTIIQEMVKQPRIHTVAAKEPVPESSPIKAPTAPAESPKADKPTTDSKPTGSAPTGSASADAKTLDAAPTVRISQSPAKKAPSPESVGEGDDAFQIFVKNEDIRQVLAMLGEAGNLNILPSTNVSGNVSLSLGRVSIEEALDAILKSKGLIARREGRFIYVGTADEFAAEQRRRDRVNTRIYRPNYVTAGEVKDLITPLMTPGVGKVSVTSPVKAGIGSDDAQAGGDSHAGREAVLVQDCETVLLQMDRVVIELDRRPLQVAIEAMILSVKLDDEHALGVDFQFLKNQGTIRLGTGSPLPGLASLSFADGGLKFAFLDSSASAFIRALETVGDTDVISTPRLLTLNKQRAEILIGAELGYVSTTVTETTSTQNVEFLQVGTQLRLRPFISSDGMIRMEIHPELSTGQVRVEEGVTLPDKEVTKVTTNIMIRDGSTVIIGGLMREDLTKNGRHIPLFGTLPALGAFFGNKDETAERREILVLVTPRIVYDDELTAEGTTAACDFHRRHMVFADKMSPLGKQYLARKYYRAAQEAWARGNCQQAMKLINHSIHISPLDRAAIDLRSDIEAGIRRGQHTLPPAPHMHFAPDIPPLPPELPEEVLPPVPPPPTLEAPGELMPLDSRHAAPRGVLRRPRPGATDGARSAKQPARTPINPPNSSNVPRRTR